MVIYINLISKKWMLLPLLYARKASEENNCDAEGIFSPVAGILGSLQANEVLKTILDFKDDLNNQMIIFDSIKSNFRNIKLSRNPYCKNKC